MTTPKTDIKVYYKKTRAEVRTTIRGDIAPLAENMRDSDRQEIWASHHIKPLQATIRSYKYSSLCLTALLYDKPFAMFGYTRDGILSANGRIWMLSTEDINKIRIEFLRYSKVFVKLMLKECTVLYNFVDARNTKSIMWLRVLGAKVSEAKPYGPENMPFHYFEFRSDKCI